jgi:hypothetical protein
MDNTSRVAQWRQRMRDEGKEALTVWLSHDAKLRLEDLASVWHATTSEMVEQALAHFHPGNPPRIGNDTDTAQLQGLTEDRVRAMLLGLKAQILQELRGERAVMATNGNITETVLAPPSAPAPTRKAGRPRSPVGQQILDLLAAHPEGLSAEQLRGALTPSKRLGDTLAGMRRLGTVRTEGAGRALRYFAALDGGAAVRAAEPDGPAP